MSDSPREKPSPASPTRIFALGWLMSRAFTSNRVAAVLAYPLCVLVLIPYALRGHLYETADHNGMVVFGRYSLLADMTIMLAVVFPVGVGWGLLGGAVGGTIFLIASIVVVVLLAIGALSMGGGMSAQQPTGPEAPKGARFLIAALAQRPGTSFSALQLGLRLTNSAPSGAVMVAVAAHERLLQGYLGLGFTRGRGNRVYRVAP